MSNWDYICYHILNLIEEKIHEVKLSVCPKWEERPLQQTRLTTPYCLHETRLSHVYLGMQPEPVSTTQSPSFWPALARPDPKVIGPGLARHGGASYAWAALQSGPPNNNRPGTGPHQNNIAQTQLVLISKSILYICHLYLNVFFILMKWWTDECVWNLLLNLCLLICYLFNGLWVGPTLHFCRAWRASPVRKKAHGPVPGLEVKHVGR